MPAEENKNKMEGIKNDQNKDRWDLLPYDAIEQIVKVFTHGATRYSDRNWEHGISYSRLFAALQRHLTAFYQHHEDNDPEWNLSHLAHAGCCLTMLLAEHLRGMKQFDDRPKNLKSFESLAAESPPQPVPLHRSLPVTDSPPYTPGEQMKISQAPVHQKESCKSD